MHDFKYKRNELYCESVSIGRLAKKYGTPLYVYSRKTFLDHYRKLEDAFRSVRPIICYSVKANSSIAILRTLVKKGAGLDIVSGGELFRALKAGASPRKIVYASVGKTEQEIEYAIKSNILLFNVESLAELCAIDRIARRLRKRQSVAIRVNPNVRAKTHRYITTGHKQNKFGIDIDTARDIFLNRREFRNLDISGVHLHIGSQIVDAKPFIRAIEKLVRFVKDLGSRGIQVKWFNIGGGLGIIYSGERPQTAQEYAKAILPLLKRLDSRIILEPGRFIAGNAGVLVAKVLYIKEAPGKNFAIVDTAMNDLVRPSLYEAFHEILPVASKPYKGSGKIRKYDIVGPVCESGDFLGKDRKFIGLNHGDFLAVMSAGAYGYSMASNYNSRPRPTEVLVEGNRARLITRRETYSDLIRAEV
ncbi:MAG: diaminopimelate decarboxylase [Candidatus Omnitrophica bacterium]|nr:diaminopimelate decarboxylase [Candidatus Omnitrophota bacterium]MBU4589864.1 diaminopimelate decarboxylase [Candidatus Omnitrophota bacterium]